MRLLRDVPDLECNDGLTVASQLAGRQINFERTRDAIASQIFQIWIYLQSICAFDPGSCRPKTPPALLLVDGDSPLDDFPFWSRHLDRVLKHRIIQRLVKHHDQW